MATVRHVAREVPLTLLLLAIGFAALLAGLPLQWWWAIYVALIAATLVVEYRRQLTARATQTAELERLLGESRLEALRTQLHPHFLFNALNTISAHIERDPRRARWMLEQLGNLLRMSLEHAREQEMPLERELAFIECYVELQRVRFDDRIAVITKVEPDVMDALVPSLILQPLVENAVRHGIGTAGTAGQIEIRAWRERDSLRLSVHDDGPGLPPDWDPVHDLGVGLSNTRERLHRLYGEGQRFEIASGPGAGGVRVALTLPYRRDGPTTAVGASTRTAVDSHGS